MIRILTKKIMRIFHNLGAVLATKEHVDVYRAAIKAGCNEKQAVEIARLTYNASQGYHWNLDIWALVRWTKERNAAQYPNGKDAEELKAEREGRPSRWGTPDFHGLKN